MSKCTTVTCVGALCFYLCANVIELVILYFTLHCSKKKTLIQPAPISDPVKCTGRVSLCSATRSRKKERFLFLSGYPWYTHKKNCILLLFLSQYHRRKISGYLIRGDAILKNKQKNHSNASTDSHLYF